MTMDEVMMMLMVIMIIDDDNEMVAVFYDVTLLTIRLSMLTTV